jgi:hypothetical protein
MDGERDLLRKRKLWVHNPEIVNLLLSYWIMHLGKRERRSGWINV